MTFSQMVSPLLYFVTFGTGLGDMVNVDGQPYLHYLIPGLLAMTIMRNSYTSASTRISVMRLHEKNSECYLYSPTWVYSFAIGYILVEALRGMYSEVFTLLLGLVSRAGLVYNGRLLAAVVLNAWIFPALEFLAVMVTRSYYGMNSFTNVVITSMPFPCETFFSLEGIPRALKWLVNVMPLTHTIRLIRRLSFEGSVNWTSIAVSALFAVVFTGCRVWICYREAKWLRFRSDLGRPIDTAPPFSYSNLRVR